MNLRRLKYFLCVVETGQVTAAAARLHIAQPALSRQLKTLERELKLELFEPRGTGLALTQAGREFTALARRLVAEAETTELAVSALRTGYVPRLTLAATPASTRTFLAPFIATTRAHDPALFIRTAGHYELAGLLDSGIDMIVSPTSKAPGLETADLLTASVMAHVAADHPWAQEQRTSVELAELCEHALVVPSPASVSRGVLETAVNAEGLSMRLLGENDEGLIVLALAASGHAVGLSTEWGPFGTCTVPVLSHGEPLGFPLHAAWKPEHFAAGTIASVAARLRAYVREQGLGTHSQTAK